MEDSLETYWNQPVEPARLYPSNPNIKNTHGRCLSKETDLNGMERTIPSPASCSSCPAVTWNCSPAR